jgi:RNA polymerase sigma-70 factor
MNDLSGVEASIRAVWPWFQSDDAFVAILNACGDALACGELHAADLALLHAYRRGHPDAARVLALTYTPHLRTALVRAGASEADAEDLVQSRLLRLVAEPGQPGFRGHGSLLGWLKRCLVRDLRDQQRSAAERRNEHVDPELLALLPLTDANSPYDAALFHRHARELCVALRSAVDTLNTEDRELFELHWREHLTAGQIATLVGQHRVTVQRHISALQRTLGVAVKRELEATFRLGPQAVTTLLRSLILRFDMTVASVLDAA